MVNNCPEFGCSSVEGFFSPVVRCVLGIAVSGPVSLDDRRPLVGLCNCLKDRCGFTSPGSYSTFCQHFVFVKTTLACMVKKQIMKK